ncbi:hypothetical protein HMPREF9554_02566 [Treponema phagedenis F0421]|nr:hypothetical protein HMPREF9554_02566 [Treponema phagedenis F0421]
MQTVCFKTSILFRTTAVRGGSDFDNGEQFTIGILKSAVPYC